ncbi:MAG: gliding motility-associated C-terminal domain-containing protein [Bacteroidota bacterium]
MKKNLLRHLQQIICIAILFMMAGKVIAQTPGGVGTGLVIWTKADAGIGGTTANVTSWTDQSTSGRVWTKTGTPALTINSAGFNYNPAIKFPSTSYFFTAQFLNALTAGEVFSVQLSNNNNGTSAVQYPFEFGGTYVANTESVYTWTPNDHYTYFGSTIRRNFTYPAGVNVRNPHLLNISSATNDWAAGIDGKAVLSSNVNTVNFVCPAGANNYIGAGHVSIFRGDISEVLVFSRKLGALERQQVQSYLAVKYGLTLGVDAPVDYLASDGTTKIWDATVNSGYAKHITVIGRDDAGMLSQKQSISADTGFVTLAVGSTIAASNLSNTGTITNDKSFLAIADNNLPATSFASTVTSPNVNYRMARVWKVSKTNWADQTITLKPGVTVTTQVYLLIGTDPTFATYTTELPLASDKTVTFNSNLLPNGTYFTFATLVRAPGGILGARAWLRADDGVSTGATWQDQSGNGNNATQGTAGSQPATVSGSAANGINYNPGLNFDGTDDAMDFAGNLGVTGSNPFTLFSTNSRKSIGTYDGFLGQPGLSTGTLSWGLSNTNQHYVTITNVLPVIAGSTTYATANVPRMFSMTRGNGGGNIFNLYTNGAADGSGTIASGLLATALRIGGRQASEMPDMVNPEVIVYDRTLTTTELQRVNSYQAIKYGITLSNSGGGTNGDYTSSSGALIWDADNGAAYHNNIIGIARDDISSLLQKQSRQSDDATRIYIDNLAATNALNAGTFTSDAQFVMMGNNNAALAFNNNNAEYPSGLGAASRFDREWKITNTGFTGTFSLSILPAGNNFDVTKIKVLVDDDGDFSNAATQIFPTVTLAGGRIILTGISNAMIASGATKYITLAVQRYPGGVTDNHKLWTRADAGVIETSANVTQWTNLSIEAMVTQASATASTDITLNSNNFNYNPTLVFTGASGKTLSGTFGSATTNPALMFAVVKKATSPNTSSGNPYSLGGAGAAGIGYAASGGTGTYMIDHTAGGCSATPNAVNIPALVRVDYNAAADASGAVSAFNGLLSSADCGATALTAPDGTFQIGGRTYGGQTGNVFAGEIAEVIHYDLNVLSGGAADINKIESYLALKYGLTLSNSGGGTNGNYTSSAGTSIWNASIGAGYHNKVIGIGRDDNTALLQNQSHDASDSVRIYIGSTVATSNLSNTGSFSTDGQFVMIGHDNGSMTNTTSSTEYPAGLGITGRIPREWKITNTGFTGTFSVDIRSSIGGGVNGGVGRLRILIDDDGDFTNATVMSAAISSTSGGSAYLTISGITTTMIPAGTTRYIAIVQVPSPGGLSDNIALWTKADAGVTAAGVNVSQWTNQANRLMTTQPSVTASSAITLDPDNFNYNPTLIYTGASGQRLAGTFATAPKTGALIFAAVKKYPTPTNNTFGAVYSQGPQLAANLNVVVISSSNAVYCLERIAGSQTSQTANIMNIPGIARADYVSPLTNIDNGTNSARTAFNNVVSTFGSAAAIPEPNGTFEIGGSTLGGAGRIYTGEIAEVIHYDLDNISGNGTLRVESYLAIKYGITLGTGLNTTGNYASSAVTNIWTSTTGPSYHNNVIGIGRDDASGLLQKQSHQANDLTRIYLGTLATSNALNAGSFSGDRQFVLIGNNNGALSNTGSTEYPAGINGRLTREWKVTNTGFTGVFSLDITPTSICNNTGLRLLVDDDGDFSNGGTNIFSTADGLTFTNAGGVMTIGGISNAIIPAGSLTVSSTRYITIATAVTVAAAQTICYNSTPADITLSGYTGTIVKWQYSSNNFGSDINDIPSSASAVLSSVQMGPLTSTRYYRAVITDWTCATVNSSALTVTVDPLSVGGSAPAQQICTGTSPNDITLTGHTGNVTKWQYSVNADFSGAIDIPASNAATLTSAQIGALNQTTYFRAIVQSGVCATATSATVTVTVNALSVGGTPATAQTICAGTSPTDLTLSGQTGSVTKWQYSINADFSGAVDIAASNAVTLTSAQIGNLNQTTYFRAVVQNGVCAVVNSATVTVTVDPVTVGGTPTAAQTICAGTSPADLTLGGHTGTVTKWQYSVNADFSSPTDLAVASSTLTSAQIGNLTQTTYFRAVVQSGVCAVINSATVTVTIDPVSIGGTPTTAQTICAGTSPANLTLSGNTGNVTKWQYSTAADFSGATDIAVASTTLTGAQIGNLNQTTYFRAVVQSGVCATATSATVTVTVDPVTVGGTPTSAQTICANTSPANLTLAGNTGTVTKWQYSVNADFSSPTDIVVASSSLTSAQIGSLTQTTYFRAVVQSGVCAVINSATVTVTVDPVSIGGTPTAAQTICANTSPANLTLSGHTGIVTKWQRSVNADFSSATDIAVASTTLTGAQIGNLTQTTYFRAMVQNGVCAAVASGIVTVTVDPVTVGGTPTAAQTICTGTSPANLTLGGHTGSVTKWQYSVNADFSSATDLAVASSTLTSAQIGNLTQTTYFRAVVQSGVCAVINSATVTVTVDPVTVGGTPTSAQMICANTSPANLTLSGNTGSVTKWQRSVNADFSSATDLAIASSTLTSAQIGNLTQTTYFRAVVQSGVCAVINSATVTVTVDPVTVGGTPTSAQMICANTSPANLTLSGNTGSVTKWQRSVNADFSSATDIAVASTTLTGAQIGNLTQTTYFRAMVQNGVCAAVASGIVTITVDAVSIGGTPTAAQTICTGTSPANLTLGGNTGSVIKWQYSTAADFSSATDIAVASTTLTGAQIGNLTQTTYFRAMVQNGVCAAVASGTVTITVNAPSVGGTPTAAQTICSGNSPANLTLSGNTGSVTKWQYSTAADFSGATDIAVASTTLTSAQIGTLAQTTYFRAMVQNGVCTVVASAPVTITVNAPSAGGTPSPAQTICPGTSPATLTLGGNVGSVTKWQYSTVADFSGATDIAVASNTLTGTQIGNLTQTTYFRAAVTSGVCPTLNSSALAITVLPAAVGGVPAALTQTICSGTPASDIILNGHTGNVIKWQYSGTSNFSSDINDISASASSTLTSTQIGTLTSTRYFRAVVQVANCSVTANSAIAAVVVNPLPIVTINPASAEITNGQTITLTASGASTYSWSPANGLSATTGATVNVNPNATTVYAVVGTDANSCQGIKTIEVKVNGQLYGGTIGTDQTICAGSIPATLTSTANASGGTGNISYQWQSSTDNLTFANISGAVSATFTPTAITQTTYYRRGAFTGGDVIQYTGSVTVTAEQSVGGTVTGSATVCAANNLTVLNLTGYTGTITKWQSSPVSNFASGVTDIAQTTVSLSVTNLTATTYYRAVVQQGTCASSNSTAGSVTVNPLPNVAVNPTAAAITRGQSVTLTASGAASYSWAPSTGLSATNTASVTASPTNTVQATVYTVTGSSGSGCTNTASVTIIVNPALTAGNIAADQTICSGTAPATFTSTTAAAGGTGTKNYQWQSSPDNVSFTDIPGAVSDTYAPGALTQTTYYRRGVSTSNDGVTYTNSVLITIQKTVGGTINGSATVDPGINSTLLQLTGSTGSVVKWQSSLLGNFTDAVDIANTGFNYSANNVNNTTHYRAVLQQGSCAQAFSLVAIVTVRPVIISLATFTTIDPGTIAADQVICTGSTPAGLTSTAAATGGTATITYQWQVSTDNENFTNIPLAIAATYAPGVLTQTTYYRRGALSISDDIAYTASVTIKVQQSIAGTVTVNGPTTVCAGNNNVTLTLAGHSGNVLRWESSTVADFSSGITTIANTTTGLAIVNLATTTYYRAVVQASPCAIVNSAAATVTAVAPPAVSVSPSSITVTPGKTTTLTVSGNADSYLWTPSTALSSSTGTTVDASPSSSITYSVTGTRTIGNCTSTATVNVTVVTNLVGGSISSDQVICSGTVPAAFTSVNATGGTGTIQYQWQQSLDNITFTDITTATAATYVAPALTQTTYYRRKAFTATDADEFTNSVKIDVTPSTGGTVNGSAAVCSGTNNPILTLSGQTGNVIKWQSSPVNNFGSGVTDISNTTTNLNLQNLTASGTLYYRAVVQSGTCAVSNSAPASITVNQLPVITIDPVSAHIVSGSSIVLKASGADSYVWTPSTALSSTNAATVTAIPNSTILYTAAGTISSTGCSAKASITITVDEALNPGSIVIVTNGINNISPQDKSFCSPATGIVLNAGVASSGGVGSYQYKWQSSSDNTSFTDIPGATTAGYTTGTLVPGVWYIRKAVTSGIQTSFTQSVKITVAPPVAKPVITASGPLKLSANGSVMLASTAAVTYLWSNGSNTQTVTVTTPTVGIYKVTVKDALGCSSVESDAVTVIPPPPSVIDSTYISSSISNPPNTGVQVTAVAGGTLRYYLQTGGTAVPVPVLPTAIGQYTYYVSQVINGIESDPIPYKVTILRPLVVADHRKLLTSSPVVQTDGSVLIGFTFLMTNKHTARIDSVKLTDDLSIVFPALAIFNVQQVTATGNLIVNPSYNGTGVTNMLLPASWLAPGTTDTVKLVVRLASELSGTLENKSTMDAKSQFGWLSIASNDPLRGNGDLARNPTPFVLPETSLDIPSGFSPNRDGINDKFVIRHPADVSINLKVFNRWGNIVHASADYKDDWDGRGTQSNMIGAELPDGTYYYVIVATNKTTGKIVRSTGDITIKRQ